MSTTSDNKLSLMKIIPVTVLVTILSQCSILMYYNDFNFSPLTYFESYEIIIASVKEFVIIACYTVIILQTSIVLLVPILRDWDSKDDRTNFKNWAKQAKVHAILFYIFSFIILIVIYFLNRYSSYNRSLLMGMLILFSNMLIYANNYRYQILTSMKRSRYRQIVKTYPFIDSAIVSIIACLFVGVTGLSDIKSKYIKANNPYKGTLLITEDNEKIRCTSKVLFIGKSQKYYFLFNTPDSSIRVVGREKLKKEVIKINPKTNFLFRF